ncbi:MAG: ABC transporter permease [Candidatus Odinarchaeota archaeon]
MRIANFEISFQKRVVPITGINAIGIRVISLVLGLVAVGAIFLIIGVNPISLYLEMIQIAFSLRESIFVRFIPLCCIAVGLAIPFKARVDNIGAEGQYTVGVLAAFWTGHYLFPDFPPIVLIPLMFISGFLAGAIWALPVVFFRARGGFQGADVVVSFLMVFPALYLLEYLVSGPWRDPETGFTYSEYLNPSAHIPRILDTGIHLTIVLVLIITLLLYYFLFKMEEGVPKTKLGYEIKVAGKNPLAGRVAGMSFFKIILVSMIISGGLAGIAGVGEIAGNNLRLTVKSPGYGFTAIAVAYLGGLNPIGIIISSFFFAALFVGGIAIKISGLPGTAIDMFSGVILFFVLLSEFFFRYRIDISFFNKKEAIF